ncbi:carboxymuconolactone decarboxylase family protein [Nonomuraea jabiensis]|uniref:carboxymuconolactone decarboxylase family protein n=1 Tax=Nonomuraea jabiensis TaxID=882448 RepID=UPI003D722766
MPARLEPFRPADLTAEQRRLYDRLLGSRRARGPRAYPLADGEGRLQGPFNAMLLNPELGDALQELGGAVRFGTGLTPRQREIAILAVAAHERSDYEWEVHSHAGRQEGLTDADLAALRERAPAPFDDPAERLVLETVRELLETGDLGDATFAAALESLDQARLYGLVTLVGYYRLLAVHMRVLRIDA